MNEILSTHCWEIDWHVSLIWIWNWVFSTSASNRPSWHFQEIQPSPQSMNVLLICFFTLIFLFHLVSVSLRIIEFDLTKNLFDFRVVSLKWWILLRKVVISVWFFWKFHVKKWVIFKLRFSFRIYVFQFFIIIDFFHTCVISLWFCHWIKYCWWNLCSEFFKRFIDP